MPLGFEEATRFIPPSSQPGLIPALQWVAIGLLIVVFLWFRPQGVLPERAGSAHGSTSPTRSESRADRRVAEAWALPGEPR